MENQTTLLSYRSVLPKIDNPNPNISAEVSNLIKLFKRNS